MKKSGFARMAVALTIAGWVGVGLSGVAMADRGHGKDKSAKHYEENYTDSIAHGILGIGDHDRNAIRQYLAKDFKKKCPPGLAKKNNGCLPPGQAKKYRVGYALPDGVNYSPISKYLRDLLSQPPQGYQYVQVDKDVLLMSEAGKKVIDAVTLLSAVGQ